MVYYLHMHSVSVTVNELLKIYLNLYIVFYTLDYISIDEGVAKYINKGFLNSILKQKNKQSYVKIKITT